MNKILSLFQNISKKGIKPGTRCITPKKKSPIISVISLLDFAAIAIGLCHVENEYSLQLFAVQI